MLLLLLLTPHTRGPRLLQDSSSPPPGRDVGCQPARAMHSSRPVASSATPEEDGATVAACHLPSCAPPCPQTAQPGQWVLAFGDTRDGDRFGVSLGEAPACARVVRACQVAGAGWDLSVCCPVLRAHSRLHEAPALLHCLHPKVSGSTGADPQNCSGAGPGWAASWHRAAGATGPSWQGRR